MIIVGVTNSGQKFRPSDWTDRLCGCLSAFESDQKITYSPYLKPMLLDNNKCVVVDKKLELVDPVAFKFLLSFAKDNDLKIQNREILNKTS